MLSVRRMSYVGAIDQGTTSTRFILFSKAGDIVSSAQKPFKQWLPEEGRTEHDPDEIWATVEWCVTEALKAGTPRTRLVSGKGLVVWRRHFPFCAPPPSPPPPPHQPPPRPLCPQHPPAPPTTHTHTTTTTHLFPLAPVLFFRVLHLRPESANADLLVPSLFVTTSTNLIAFVHPDRRPDPTLRH